MTNLEACEWILYMFKSYARLNGYTCSSVDEAVAMAIQALKEESK